MLPKSFKAAIVEESPEWKILFAVLKNCKSVHADWDAVAKELGANHKRSA